MDGIDCCEFGGFEPKVLDPDFDPDHPDFDWLAASEEADMLADQDEQTSTELLEILG